ncbi:hypothetical protein EDC02_6335 [Micromonospora sp. Llam0]|uniref:hypothetical protein n=1 Tax=Micromonospora sp. Llam0 TaxID=2485143 RepID=UPI000F4A54CA|nr:hypothetical protein [Micromonospora sp. Llam0]ROO51457.1 hypothetical protein EDC02_6335 [Micromonospora sp. Llam0]
MDAVYLVGPATDELRYSLRSLHNLGCVDRLVVVGHRPVWCRPDLHIPVQPPRPGKHFSTWANLRAAAHHPEVSPQFVLMNDDFFTLHRMDRPPVWHRGPIAGQVANHRRSGNRRLLNRRLGVDELLDAIGVPGRLDYELHVPLLVDQAAMRDVIALAEQVRTVRMEPVGKRTLYGNYARIGGDQVEDVKIRDFRAIPSAELPFVSTSDYSFRQGTVGRWIRKRFPDQSRYEEGGRRG